MGCVSATLLWNTVELLIAQPPDAEMQRQAAFC